MSFTTTPERMNISTTQQVPGTSNVSTAGNYPTQLSSTSNVPINESFRNMTGTIVVRPLTVKLMFESETLSHMDILVRVLCGNNVQQTRTRIEGSLNPSAGEQLNFKRTNEDFLKFEVWDNANSDFIGCGEVPISTVLGQNNRLNDWICLRCKGKETGQLLVDIQFCSDQMSQNVSRSTGVETLYYYQTQPIILQKTMRSPSQPQQYLYQPNVISDIQHSYQGDLHSNLPSGYQQSWQPLTLQQGYLGDSPVYQHGYQPGMTQGLSQGFTQGSTQGLSQGFTQGSTQGLSQGFAQGMTQQPSYQSRYSASYPHVGETQMYHEPLLSQSLNQGLLNAGIRSGYGQSSMTQPYGQSFGSFGRIY